jgi:hypothetical protein
MNEKLEAYLEEIGHFLSGRSEREEIIREIRGHILEKAEREHGNITDDAIDKAVAGYGPARRVAEKYLDGRPIIAPAYRRFLFRYTSILFAVHFLLTAVTVIFKKDFVLFPLIFIPRLGIVGAVMYLPTAFLTDLGIVVLVLYFLTQSGKDIRLPWPKFALDLDEVKPPRKVFWERVGNAVGTIVMLALTDGALYLYAKYHTIFFKNFDVRAHQPLFTPEAGERYSLIVIGMLALGALSLFAKIFTSSRWVDIVSSVLSLVLIGLFLSRPFDNPFAVALPDRLLPTLRYTAVGVACFIALMTTIELVKNLIRVARKKMANGAA